MVAYQFWGSPWARRQDRLTSDRLTGVKRRDRPHRASLAYTRNRHFLASNGRQVAKWPLCNARKRPAKRYRLAGKADKALRRMPSRRSGTLLYCVSTPLASGWNERRTAQSGFVGQDSLGVANNPAGSEDDEVRDALTMQARHPNSVGLWKRRLSSGRETRTGTMTWPRHPQPESM